MPEVRANREQRLADLRVFRKAQYLDRKSRQVCVHCGGALAPDDGVACSSCDGNDKTAKAIRRETPAGRAALNKRTRKLRARRRAANTCITCPNRSKPGSPRCVECLASNAEATKRYRAKKRDAAPVVDLLERKRLRELRANPTADVSDWPLFDRLIVAMRFLDWTHPVEIFDHANVPREENPRRAATQCLTRKRRNAGRFDGVVGASQYEYRLTRAGIDAANARRSA